MQGALVSPVGSATRTFPFPLGGGRVLNDPAEGLVFLSEPRPGGEKIKTAVDRAARRAKLTYWRAFDIWYRKARRVEDYEIDAIIQAAEAKNSKEIREEVYELRNRLARIESLLVAQDPEFHRPSIDHARAMVRGLSGKDRA